MGSSERKTIIVVKWLTEIGAVFLDIVMLAEALLGKVPGPTVLVMRMMMHLVQISFALAGAARLRSKSPAAKTVGLFDSPAAV